MKKWCGSSKGLIEFDGQKFALTIDVSMKGAQLLHEMTRQICEYRLHSYFERKSQSRNNTH
ncbi:hypothetical protein [Pontibacillus litoralis]|uniref:hypothetical protein n=1 Tax=Pontibacillus litoralis TaxID=516703 RepID=UPI0012ECBA4C|nr:hypothetical protein [Pontibacillus litoralis]